MGKAALFINTADMNVEFLSEKHYDRWRGKKEDGKIETFFLLVWGKIVYCWWPGTLISSP